jgi:hypothetical protein
VPPGSAPGGPLSRCSRPKRRDATSRLPSTRRLPKRRGVCSIGGSLRPPIPMPRQQPVRSDTVREAPLRHEEGVWGRTTPRATSATWITVLVVPRERGAAGGTPDAPSRRLVPAMTAKCHNFTQHRPEDYPGGGAGATNYREHRGLVAATGSATGFPRSAATTGPPRSGPAIGRRQAASRVPLPR